MNDFVDDDKWQREQRDRYLVPLYYRKCFSSFQLCDRLPDEQRRGIDTIITIGRTHRWTIDEKIVRKKHTAFVLETKSCTVPGYEKPGWMFTNDVDRLLYCFSVPNGLDCFMIDFHKLHSWFWAHENTFPSFQMDTKNRTAGRVVDIGLVERAGFIIRNFELREGTKR